MRPARLAALLALFAPAAVMAERADPGASRGAAVVEEINRVRADPSGYADELRAYRKLIRGKVVALPGLPHGLQTKEGVAAVDEAIRVLERQPPLPPLAQAPLLARAAADHIRDQSASGKTGHIGGDGSNPGVRLKRRGGEIYVAESITYGPERVVDVVRQLIIDDGVPKRGHRTMLLDRRWYHAGASCGHHRVYRQMCVIGAAETATGGLLSSPTRSTN